MKILMIAPLPKDIGGSYTTGVGKVALELSRQCFGNDITIYLSSTNIKQKKAREISKYENQYNGYQWLIWDIIVDFIIHPLKTLKELSTYKNKCHSNPFRFEFFKVNIRRHIRKITPDIIHVHTTEAVPARFANERNVPIICTMHGVFYRGEPSQKNLGDFLGECVNSCDFFTGLTKECDMLMKKYFHIPNEKLTIIPNGVNTDLYFFDSAQRNIIRERNGVKENEIVFITVASIQKRKGQLRFIKALQKLKIDYKYWILGEGPDKQKVFDYCEQNNLHDKVVLFGNVDSKELYKFYSAADVYAHPSTMEGQALCEMEAYATGIRTIVSNEIKDTIETDIENKDVYYILNFNSFDTKGLTSWIMKGNPNRLSRKDVSWSLIAKKYSRLYQDIYKFI